MTVFHISDALLLPSPEDGRVSSEEDLEFFSNEADSIYFFLGQFFQRKWLKGSLLTHIFHRALIWIKDFDVDF